MKENYQSRRFRAIGMVNRRFVHSRIEGLYVDGLTHLARQSL